MSYKAWFLDHKFKLDHILENTPGSASGKESACQCKRLRFDPRVHCSILAWRIPRTEESGNLQSMGCKELDETEYSIHTGKYKALLRKIKEDLNKKKRILFTGLKTQYCCQFLPNWCINSTQSQSKAQQLKSDCKSLSVLVAQSCKSHMKVEGPRLVKLTKSEAY